MYGTVSLLLPLLAQVLADYLRKKLHTFFILLEGIDEVADTLWISAQVGQS